MLGWPDISFNTDKAIWLRLGKVVRKKKRDNDWSLVSITVLTHTESSSVNKQELG